MRTTGLRLLLVAIVLGTLFPISVVMGTAWTLVFLISGISKTFAGEAMRGLPLIAWSALALYGLFTLMELTNHFWRTPHHNPTGKALTRDATGLAAGWLALTVSPFKPFWDFLFIGAFYLISVAAMALALTVWFLVILVWTRTANNTPHPDARDQRVASPSSPSLAPGEREH